jgi:Flp pilus assembly protein TadD
METFPILYVIIPPHLRKKLFGQVHFAFDLSIPLPVELLPEMQKDHLDFLNNKKQFNTEKIKLEMILSGILQELANPASPDSKNSDYYRNLVYAIKPTIANELQEAAVIKAKNGDYKTALEIFDLLFGLKGQNPKLLLNRALILEECTAAGVILADDDVEIAYEKALAYPVPDTLFYAALYYEQRGNFFKAASCLESYLDDINEEDSPDAYDDKYVKARELLAEIRNNGLADNAFMEAVALIRKGYEEQGIDKARDFLERHPGAGRGWFVLGWGLRCLSRWGHAIECFNKALTLGCVNADTHNELAICCLETGDHVTAEKELEKAFYLDPENVKIICNMGVLAMKQGNMEKAAAFFRTVLDLDGNDPIASAFFANNLGCSKTSVFGTSSAEPTQFFSLHFLAQFLLLPSFLLML